MTDKRGRAYYAAHFCHQAIEKMLKAVIAEKTDKIPLPTHNFKLLLDQAKLHDFPEKGKEFIFSMMPHYIGTKYPEDIVRLYQRYTKTFVTKLYQNTQEIFKWLKALLK